VKEGKADGPVPIWRPPVQKTPTWEDVARISLRMQRLFVFRAQPGSPGEIPIAKRGSLH